MHCNRHRPVWKSSPAGVIVPTVPMAFVAKPSDWPTLMMEGSGHGRVLMPFICSTSVCLAVRALKPGKISMSSGERSSEPADSHMSTPIRDPHILRPTTPIIDFRWLAGQLAGWLAGGIAEQFDSLARITGLGGQGAQSSQAKLIPESQGQARLAIPTGFGFIVEPI